MSALHVLHVTLEQDACIPSDHKYSVYTDEFYVELCEHFVNLMRAFYRGVIGRETHAWVSLYLLI